MPAGRADAGGPRGLEIAGPAFVLDGPSAGDAAGDERHAGPSCDRLTLLRGLRSAAEAGQRPALVAHGPRARALAGDAIDQLAVEFPDTPVLLVGAE